MGGGITSAMEGRAQRGEQAAEVSLCDGRSFLRELGDGAVGQARSLRTGEGLGSPPWSVGGSVAG